MISERFPGRLHHTPVRSQPGRSIRYKQLMTRLVNRPRTLVAGALGLVLAAAGVYAILRPSPPQPESEPPPGEADDIKPAAPPPDPRLTFPTNFRNVKPDVAYVGDKMCADCHGGICATYRDHPMGHSAEFVSRVPVIEKYESGAGNPWKVGGYELRAEKTANGVVHHVSAKDSTGAPLPEYAVSADVAIGSGTRGRSYLSVERGAVWQSPVSWFSAESRWDISPGFDLGTGGRRAIIPACLYCHTNRVEPVPGAINRYREPLFPVQAAIGCERCHGPGALHVAERALSAPSRVDTSIVNPKHLSPALQSSVCEQCHLQGQERIARRGRDAFEFRPGLPFEQFVTVFVRHPDLADASRSVGQFEQLEQSRCRATGGGRLLCTNCHDPHATSAPADRDRFYRQRCNTCHESKGCTAPQPDRAAKNDSCVACHMPRTGSSNIAHASVTDHRILPRPVPPSAPRGLPPGASPLVAFGGGSPHVPEAELERDLGVALARQAGRLPPGRIRQLVGEQARDKLTASLVTWRGDADAWAAMSVARDACGDAEERMAAAERAARLAPGSEEALAEVAAAALTLGRFDRAEEAATALVGMNPSSVEYLISRATIFAAQKRWESAEADCRAALRIHPLHPHARLLLAICLHWRGDAAAGQREADTAAGLATDPRQRAAMLERYRRQTR